MQRPYQERHDTPDADRPRDQYGRFESESENRSRYRGQDEYRNEEEQFGGNDRRGYNGQQDQPRDEYGRFESGGARRTHGSSYQGSTSHEYDRQRDDFGSNAGSRWSGQQGSQDWQRDDNGRFTSGNYQGDQQRWGSSGNDRFRDENERFDTERNQRGYQNRSSMDWQGGSTQRGLHAGKGPKGYQRSDQRIQEDVNETLAQDPHLDASEIEVKVQDGIVTLTGTVSERNFKRMAEDLAERCSGVKDVHNEIRTGQPSNGSSEKTTTKTSTASSGKNA